MDEKHIGSARNRVKGILDANSFVEIGCHIQHNSTAFGLDKQVPGDGVAAGYGTIANVPVYIYAQDFAAFDGSLGSKNADKIARVYDAAVKNGVPVISVLDSAGARLAEGTAALDGYAKVMKSAAKASGVVPQIAIVCGPAIGAASVIAELADFVFVTEEAELSMVSPVVREAAEGKGEKSYPCEYDFMGSEAEIAETVKKLLALLPLNSLEDPPMGEQIDDFNRILASCSDVRSLVSSAADFGEFLELKKDFAPGLVTGLARFGGFLTGVVANDKAVNDGRLDGDALQKAARFIGFLDSFGIAVVSLVDTPGFVLSNCEEKRGLSKKAAQLAYSYASADVPVITVITGSAIGGAYSVMGSKELGADMVFAFPDASVAPIEADLASVLYYDELEADSREEKIAEYKKKYADPMEAAHNGSIDRIIEKSELRQMIVSALIMQATKHAGEPMKSHGNMPL